MVYGGVIKRLSLQRLRLLLKITSSLSLYLWSFNKKLKSIFNRIFWLIFSLLEMNKNRRAAEDIRSSKN